MSNMKDMDLFDNISEKLQEKHKDSSKESIQEIINKVHEIIERSEQVDKLTKEQALNDYKYILKIFTTLIDSNNICRNKLTILNKDLSDSRKEIDELKSIIQSKDSSIDKLKATIQSKDSYIDELNQIVITKNKENKDLTDELENKSMKISSTELENKRLSISKVALEKANQEINREINKLTENNEQLSLQYDELVQSNGELKEVKEKLNKVNLEEQSTKNRLINLKNECLFKEKELKSTSEKIDNKIKELRLIELEGFYKDTKNVIADLKNNLSETNKIEQTCNTVSTMNSLLKDIHSEMYPQLVTQIEDTFGQLESKIDEGNLKGDATLRCAKSSADYLGSRILVGSSDKDIDLDKYIEDLPESSRKELKKSKNYVKNIAVLNSLWFMESYPNEEDYTLDNIRKFVNENSITLKKYNKSSINFYDKDLVTLSRISELEFINFVDTSMGYDLIAEKDCWMFRAVKLINNKNFIDFIRNKNLAINTNNINAIFMLNNKLNVPIAYEDMIGDTAFDKLRNLFSAYIYNKIPDWEDKPIKHDIKEMARFIKNNGYIIDNIVDSLKYIAYTIFISRECSEIIGKGIFDIPVIIGNELFRQIEVAKVRVRIDKSMNVFELIQNVGDYLFEPDKQDSSLEGKRIIFTDINLAIRVNPLKSNKQKNNNPSALGIITDRQISIENINFEDFEDFDDFNN